MKRGEQMGKKKKKKAKERKPAWKYHKLTLEKDPKKSYWYVKDGKKDLGYFAWHFKKNKYVFHSA